MAKTPVIEVLFPEFGNLAGDNGNAEYLERCLPAARFIRTPSQDEPAFAKEDVDLIVMSNMTETQQERALERLRPHAQRLAELADAGVPMLFTGAAAEVMGESFQTIDGRELAGLGLFAFAHEQNMPKRYLSAFAGSFEPKAGAAAIPIVGFHAQFTQLAGDNSGCYFAKGERGWGINEGTQLDGFVRGGAIATTLVGPLLPTNPDFCAWLIERVCKEKLPLAFEEVARRAFQARWAELTNPAVAGKEIEF